jgi:hypothetical protein
VHAAASRPHHHGVPDPRRARDGKLAALVTQTQIVLTGKR